MSLHHRHHERCACGSTFSEYRAGAALAKPFALSGVRRVYERSRPFSIKHIALDIELIVEKKSFAALAQLDLVRVDKTATEVSLDAVGFEIESLEIGTEKAGFHKGQYAYDGETLRVTIAQNVNETSLRVRYRATPRQGMYFLAPDEHVRDRPNQVWTQCQDEDARYIFPCHDKPHIKQTTECKVTAPAGWAVLSNGELVSKPSAEGPNTYHWKMNEPHPSYLFTIVAGELTIIEDEADGIPVTYWVPKGREEDGRRTFRRTPDMIKRFGELTGVKYPWNKYAQVVVSDFIFGGMENTTATTMYEHILLDERAAIDVTADDLIAHELAHQWFGDYVTCRDWSHGWLNEGFATFMEHIDREAKLDKDEYYYGLWLDFDMYTSEAHGRYKRPIVCQDYEAPIDIFDRHLYEKGALVLHALRTELGDEAFWKGVGTYLKRHAKGVVETRDLQRALEDVSGKSLEQFFEQWVFRAGHPELTVKVAHEGEFLTVSVKQTQVNQHASGPHSGAAEPIVPVFAFDLSFEIGTENGPVTETRRVDQINHTFVMRVGKRPSYVVVDPTFSSLAEIKLEVPGDMLRTQLASASTARGRMLAAPALGKMDDPPTVAALSKSLANESEMWAVRAEVAHALGAIRSDEAFQVLSENASTKHPKVRRAVASAVGKFRSNKAVDVLKKLALSDASYLVEAEAARAIGSTRQSSAFDTLIDVLDRPSWADVVRAGAIDGLANLRDDRAIPHVMARTRYGVSTRGRRAAIMALPKIASDRKTRETLEDLLDGTDPYLRVDVVRALVDFGDPKSRPALQRQLERELDGRVRRRIREALRDIGGAGKRETDRLRDDFEALRGEYTELKARLSKIEAMVNPPEKGDSKTDASKHAKDKKHDKPRK
ncbi:MAG: HEAT repeat domain-containing protein [Polyangiaceae bacterium]|nr:HEAT repeat domain-containing protein [Polyangiaceae bacterium]